MFSVNDCKLYRAYPVCTARCVFCILSFSLYLSLVNKLNWSVYWYDFRIWGQRFFPFFQHGSMSKPYNIIILPFYSGADEAFSRNSNTNTFTPQHQIPRTVRQIPPHWRSWALRFSPFFNSAARRYYTRTSRYHTLVGLTSVIQTQTLHQTNTSNMALLGKQHRGSTE